MAVEYDLIIRNGMIMDGTGGDPYAGDVAISGTRIAAVGKVDGKGKREIDARGQLVTPGFVDIHTHYDGQAIWSDRLNPSSGHGVTTVVVGNCGVGFAPCRPSDHDLLIKYMEGVEDIPGAVMVDGLTWNWETFPQFLDALEARAHDIDVAAYFPHSPLRVYVMGERGANRERATADDLAKMRALTKEAIQAGAVGFATSRVFTHKSSDGVAIPTYEVDYAELEAIASGMSDAGSGTLQIVPEAPWKGWSKELLPLVDIGRKTGRPVTFTLGSGNRSDGVISWQDALQILDEANASGVSIKAQMLPRPIGLVMGITLSAHPFCLCPSYLAIKDLPLEQRVAEMRKPEVRQRILSEKPRDGHPLAMMARNFEWTFEMHDKPDYEPPLASSVLAQAKARGVTPEEQAYDMLLEKGGNALMWVALANFADGSLDDVHTILRNDNVVIGLGDGGAHYGMVSDSSYTTHALTHWARDRVGKQMSPQEVVMRLTSKTAKVVGLLDRGILAPGLKADINIIDLENLTLHGPEIVKDLPAGGRRLNQRATGYTATIVSGQVIADKGEPTGALPGRLVRGAQPAPVQA
jgi:N-acyl-D-aspartate/D-glutamate deacylase